MGIKTFETREALKNKLHNRKLIFSENELDEVLISHNYFNLFNGLETIFLQTSSPKTYDKVKLIDCNGVQREHNKKLNNGLPILHKVPPKRDYGRYFCIMAEKGGTSHGGLTEKLSPFFHAKKQEVNAYGR